jgi:hypothetical protein
MPPIPYSRDAILGAEIEAYKKTSIEPLLRENLKWTVEQRLLQLITQAQLGEEFDRSQFAK